MNAIAEAAQSTTTNDLIQVAQKVVKSLVVVWSVWPHSQSEKWTSLDAAICRELNCESSVSTRSAAQYVVETL